MTIELKLQAPYISADLPGVGGHLRARPEHFVVEEIPLYDASGEGQHLYVNLTKREMTTRAVQQNLAQLFNLSTRDIGFAGMKDKHALTTQTFSLNVGHVNHEFVERAETRIREAQSVDNRIRLNWVRLHRNKLKKGHLLGNRFTIVISSIELPPHESQRRAETICQRIRDMGLPNYYGPQRLGQQGANVRRGIEIILGDRNRVDRWLRNLLTASVQSYLCNRYLVARFEEGLFGRLILGDIAKKHDTGGLFEVKDPVTEQPRYTEKTISFTAPIYGPNMWAATGPAGEFEDRMLKDAGLSIQQLASAGLSGTRRMGRLVLNDLGIQDHADGLQVSFSLRKGAYATTVLREIMKVSDDALATVPDEDSDDSG